MLDILIPRSAPPLDVPAHIRDEKTMFEGLERALKEDVGFGRC